MIIVAAALLASARAGAEGPAATPALTRVARDGGDGADAAMERDADEETLAQPDAAWQEGVAPADRARAQGLFADANARFGDKDYAQALGLYRQARAAWNHPSINYNMAVCLLELEQEVEAWEALEQALRFDRGPLSAHNYANAQRFQKLLARSLAFLSVQIAEAGAQVTLDGQALLVGPGEASRVVMPGPHQLVASKDGFVTLTRSTVAAAGGETRVALVLEPITEVVSVRRWPTALPWAVVGGGALLAAGGAPLLVAAGDDYAAFDAYIDANCGAGCVPSALPAAVRDAEARGDREQGGAIALFVLGGAAMVVGAVLVVLNEPTEERRPVVTPLAFGVVPLRGGGATVTGAFGF